VLEKNEIYQLFAPACELYLSFELSEFTCENLTEEFPTDIVLSGSGDAC
jgi:hypothetical protein